MAKQLNVNLAFTADTSQAKAALQDLQNNLSKITSAPATNFTGKWTKEMQQASTAAMELKTHLQNATNIKTGTLDFTKLNQSIQKSNMSISQYGQSLLKLGPAGQQAFMSLANAISQAEIPIRRSNIALQNMMTTLKNTARWQLSSSMLHGFMSAVQSAYGYAQDLNESLNNIRIVTGQNIDQMAKFAEKANQAARALSTTTTDYTDASLIYYQQGLSDSEVEKRTAVTIKMANAAGQSAQVVSDQLTAVWNNFYDGSKSLEYYADVMTALGAATASSTDEIAGGLEKFAAIADTIGLSYEYAASALATITANTRQSEDVVGTALKTIFARIQGLNLGETLEDGTTLNKYSEALQKVGISIFDQNGELKKMDNILNEMGAKWESLNNAQQTALAQTVAGVRQYNQLISLMDNWDSGDSDSMMANLETSYNATGTLQEQADIYAESWEAAQDRVRAAAESIFSSLMDEDFFIGALNNIEKILTGVDSFIDSLGGLKGVLSTVGVLLTKTFSTQMAESLRNMAHNIYMSTAGGRQAAINEKYSELDNMQYQMSLGYEGTGSISGEAASRQYSQQIAMQKELIANSDKMSQSEIANAQKLLDLRRQIGEQVIKAAEREEQSKDRLANSKQKAYMEMGMAKGDAGVTPADIARFDAISASMKKISMESHALEGAFSRFGASVQQNGNASEKEMAELSLAVRMVGKELNMSDDEITQYMNAFKTGGEEAAKAYEKLMGLLNAKQGRNQASMQGMGVDKKTTQEIVDSYGQIRDAVSRKAEAERRAKMAQEDYKKSIQSAKGVVKDWANSLVSGAQAVMSFASILNSATSMIETLTNPDATGWEKFMAVLQSGSMIMMMTVSMFNSLAMAQKNWQKGTLKNAASTLIEAAATSLSTKANEQNARAQMKKAAGHKKDADAAVKDAIATEIEGKTTEKNNKSLKKSFKDLGKSIGDYAKAFKTQIGGGVIVAASIALIIGTITAATNQYNEAANNAENAAKAAEQLANQYQSVKENYDGFISTAKGYEEVVEGMKGLTKGTAEYNEQLLKANEYAMDLINKYDLIGKYSIQGGLIVFDEGALEDAQMQQLDALGKAQASSYMGQVASSHFTGESNQTNLNRDINSASDNGLNAANVGVTTAAGGLAGAGIAVGGAMLAGATIGSSVPVIGTIIGAVVGLIAGIVTTAVVGAESKAEDEALNNLTEYVAKNGDGIFAAKDWEAFDKMLADAQLEIKDKELVKSLYENRDAVRELTLAEVARLEREEANFEAGFAAYNMNNAQYTGLEVGQGYLNEQASNYREENIDAVREEVSGLWSGSNDDFWAKYLQYVYGQKDIDVDNTSGENVRIVDLGGGAVTVEKKNEDGVWETYGNKDGLDEDVAQEQLVNAILLERASAAMDFDTLNNLVEKLIGAGLNLEEDSALMDSILAQYADNGKIDLSNFKYSDLTKINLNALEGPMGNAVSEAITSYQNGMSEIAKEISDSDWYKGLMPEQQDLVWDIQIDEYQTLDSVKAALEASQSYINANKLTTSIDVQNAIMKAYQDGDMETFKNLYNDENSPYKDAMSYEQFLEMDPEEAFRFLETGATEISEAYEVNQKAIDDNTAAINAAKGALDRANEAAYGTDGKEDGIGGTDQVAHDARVEEQETRDALTTFDTAVGYNPNGTAYIQINDETGEAEGGRYNIPTNKNIGTTGMLWWKHTGYEAYSTVDTSGSIDAVIGPLGELLGTDSPFYLGVQKYSDYIAEAQNSETGQWSEEALTWIQNDFAPMLAAQLAKSPEYDVYREANWSEQQIIDYITSYVFSDLYNGIYEGMMHNENVLPAYNILDAARLLYQNDYIGEAEVNTAEAEQTHREAEAAAGESGAAQQNLDTYEAQRTELLENWHQQNQRFQAEIEELGFDIPIYEEMKRQLVATNAELEGQEGLLHDLAKAQLRADRGSKKMSESQEGWLEVIEESNGEGADYLQTVIDIRDAYADVFDLDPSVAALLTAEFLTSAENMNLMTEALAGNDAAWDQWKANVASALIDGVDITPQLESTLDTAFATIAEYDFGDIEIGTSLDTYPFWTAISEMQIGSLEAATAISAALSSMGVDAKIVKHTVHASGEVRTWNTSGQLIDGNGEVVDVDAQAIMESDPVTQTYYTLEGATYNGKGVTPPSGGSGGKGGGGGGGGSKPKKAKVVKKTDVVERYKEIDDNLDDIADKMDDASKAADRLWGPARLKQMKKVNEALEDEIDALKAKRKEAGDYLKQDKKDLINTGKENGVSFTFDANGNISNYDAEMTKLYNELDAAITSANADGNATESEQEKIDKIQERIDKVKEAIDQYDETRELIEDLDNDIQDKIYEWQDNNYEQLNYKLELEIEINDSEMERLEYYLGKIEGNIYKTAEAFTKMKEITDVYNDNLSNQAQYVADLENAYYAGEISLDAYKEGLRESQSATIENLQALQEQKEAMQDYYGEVMNLALEEIALYTDEMEELNSVLDHYSNILELVGKQEDYATKGKVLQSKATNLRNEMQVQQKLYEESNAEAEKWAEKMANAVEGSNEYETYKKNWIAAQEAANEAQDNMLSKTEEWAEAMKAVVENKLADLAHTMEESLTGGTSFDELLTSMERRSSLQEEYLTTTNQIYETNKLMRQAQQEIDKTTNSVAKRRLQGFINETAHMQDQNKLSQYELDIQQAKYDLLLAEIALEEAQNAKSTVRLQRDSEGNFGYVYTADSGAVAEAEQELADKQNALYNLGLEGANDYSQKYAETMQEAQDAITELTEMWMNGEIESEEEFQRRKAEIQDYYYEKLKQYSNLYQVALTTDSNVIKDAWSSDFNDMIYKTDEWKGAVDEYFAGAAESMQVWAEVCATVLSESGLDDISTKVGEIDQKSQDLKTTLIGEDGESGVVGAMMSEVEAAGKLSEAYIGIQNEIDKLIEKYEELLEKVNEDYTNPDTEVVDPAIDPDEEEEEEDPTPPTPDPDPPAGPTWDRVKAAYDRINAGKWGHGINNRIQNGKNEGFTEEEVRLGQKLINKVYGGMSLSAAKKALGFDTGGYTGDWAGSYGKLAFLHQKELVLNQGDTENFLASMEVLERILQMIDLQSASSQIGGLLNSPSIGPASSEPLEQNVHIEASFPNVSDRNEIEEAFSNLINLASQYAYRD